MRLTVNVRRRPLRAVLAAAALVVGPALVVVTQAAPASATTYTVDTTTDGAPNASDCTTPVPGSCSLRDAIAAASGSSSDTISLAAGATYQLTYCDNTNGRELRLTTDGSVTIEGNGATIEETCALGSANGVIGQQGTGTLVVRDATLTGANSDDGSGAIQAGNDANTINLERVTITGNSAAFMAGIGTCGPLTVVDSTIAGNTSTIVGHDNAVIRDCNDTILMVNSTVSGNTGGGIETGKGGTLTLVYSTIAGNVSPAAAVSNLNIDGGAFTSFGSVVTDPQGGGANCGAAGTSQGYNYESGGDTCGFSAATDVADGASPQLGALADNGGTTPTMLPAMTSPLLDRIPAANCQAGDAAGVTTDQRGVTRPQGTGCDVGSVEVAVTPVTPITPAAPITIAPSFTG